jgi:hypothetical protein
MRSLLNGRIGCIVLALVATGVGVASAAGAPGAPSAPKLITTHAAPGVSAPAAAPSLPIGSVLIYSNLGPGGAYNSSIGYVVSEPGSGFGFQRIATPFRHHREADSRRRGEAVLGDRNGRPQPRQRHRRRLE